MKLIIFFLGIISWKGVFHLGRAASFLIGEGERGKHSMGGISFDGRGGRLTKKKHMMEGGTIMPPTIGNPD